ncbi:MAG: IS3 family transposase [Nitrosotalea sp.]
MTVARIMISHGTSLRRSLHYAGVSRKKWYYAKKPRNIPVDQVVSKTVQDIGIARPTYGTRRMAAAISRELQTPVNRKQVRRIFHKLGWIEPRKPKSEIIRSGKKLLKPTAPNQMWQTDMTYIWCGIDGWCYLFNAVDTFSRKWVGYCFDISATKDAAVQCVVNAISSEKPDASRLLIRTDNGSQYISKKFRESIILLGARQEFIYYNTPEQNGHVESFHKTLKKEYIWPCEFANYQSAEIAIAKAFDDYNNHRIHSALGYVTPNEFAKSWEMRHK